jgi:hypothetical protein
MMEEGEHLVPLLHEERLSHRLNDEVVHITEFGQYQEPSLKIECRCHAFIGSRSAYCYRTSLLST